MKVKKAYTEPYLSYLDLQETLETAFSIIRYHLIVDSSNLLIQHAP